MGGDGPVSEALGRGERGAGGLLRDGLGSPLDGRWISPLGQRGDARSAGRQGTSRFRSGAADSSWNWRRAIASRAARSARGSSAAVGSAPAFSIAAARVPFGRRPGCGNDRHGVLPQQRGRSRPRASRKGRARLLDGLVINRRATPVPRPAPSGLQGVGASASPSPPLCCVPLRIASGVSALRRSSFRNACRASRWCRASVSRGSGPCRCSQGRTLVVPQGSCTTSCQGGGGGRGGPAVVAGPVPVPSRAAR